MVKVTIERGFHAIKGNGFMQSTVLRCSISHVPMVKLVLLFNRSRINQTRQVKSHYEGSKKYSTALKLSQCSEKPKNEFQYDIGFIGAGRGFNHKLPQKLLKNSLKILKPFSTLFRMFEIHSKVIWDMRLQKDSK